VAHEIAGRDDELELIRSWSERPDTGALVFTGEAGIGKTTLFRWCVDRAASSGARVLVSSPSEVEAGLPYAALADLLGPIVPDGLHLLPSRQRRALEAALVLGDDGSTLLDERAVAFAALSAFRAAAAEAPLVVAVDDAQWLDRSSAPVLAYALRRVAADENVRVVLAVRPGNQPTTLVESLPAELVETVDIRPLSLGALHRVIRTALGTALPRPTLVRVHEASGGRPFHAIELARAVDAPDRLGRGDVGNLLRDRVTALPDPTRRALLAVATAFDTSFVGLDAVLEGPAQAELAPAEAAGLVRIERGSVRLAHPLLADAVLADAGPNSVAAMHRALAAVATSPEERAVHLASAAEGPDAEIAASLDAAVRSARARGAPTSAADLAELAASVTPPEEEDARLRRVLEAADAAFAAGDIDRARALFESVAVTERPLRHRALWRLGALLDETVGPDAAIGPLRDALATRDDALASAVHRSIAQLLVYTGDVLAALDHAEAAVAAAERSADAIELAYSLGVLAFVQQMRGGRGWELTIERALDAEHATPVPDLDLSPAVIAADLYRNAMELDIADEAYVRLNDVAVERQDIPMEVWAAYGLAQVALLSGRLSDAGRLSRDLVDLAQQTGLMRLPALRCLASHAALTGDADRARSLLAELVAECEERSELLNLRGALAIQGQLSLALGDFTAAWVAVRKAREIAEEQHLSRDLFVLPLVDEVEALTLAGETEEAAALAPALGEIEQPWAAPFVARASSLVAASRGDLDGAIAQIRLAAEATEPSLPLENARTWLALGRMLRRAKKRGEARRALDEARRRFDELGAPLWAEQAAQELGRLEGRAPREPGLTPTERQIAGLVARGQSNKEAAAALFLSVKTVEVSLTRVYKKLGVRGRAELAARHDELLKP
jgi:DNA-binding CsgD family transcriptional regulator